MKHIQEEPRRISMGTWFNDFKSDTSWSYNILTTSLKSVIPPCGTVGCIAGWAIQLSGDGGYGHGDGKSSLKINEAQAISLFYVSSWPQHFRDVYQTTSSKAEQAKVVCRRIRHFIKTGQ